MDTNIFLRIEKMTNVANLYMEHYPLNEILTEKTTQCSTYLLQRDSRKLAILPKVNNPPMKSETLTEKTTCRFS
jgi:hypothetical protein